MPTASSDVFATAAQQQPSAQKEAANVQQQPDPDRCEAARVQVCICTGCLACQLLEHYTHMPMHAAGCSSLSICS